jgi:hypothetical protein
MATYKILLTYVNISDSDLPLKALTILDRMTGNNRLANPTPALDTIRTALEAYQANLNLVQLGDERSLNIKNQTRDELKLLLHALAGFVIGVAKNNLDVLLSSGFDISKTRSKRALDDLSIANGGQSGQVVSTMNGAGGARMYWHQYTHEPMTSDSVWTEVMTTTRKHVHTGLQPRTGYWFRVKAITRDGQEILTDPVLRVVL